MKVLVLGGQGFIGHNLCNRLIKEHHEVIIFTKNIDSQRFIDGCKYVEGDFSKIGDYANSFDNIDVIYHLVSTTNAGNSNNNKIFDVESNIIGTLQLLDIAVTKGVSKVIFASSGGTVYGIPNSIPIKETDDNFPISSYGITKLTIEKYLYLYNYLYNLDYQILRISNPYGPFHVSNDQGLINVFLNKIKNGEEINVWGDGSVSRDYIYIDDLIDALYLSMIRKTKTKILNIGSGKGSTINEIIEIIKNVVNIDVKVNYIESRMGDVPINVLDISKAIEELDWNINTDLITGISKTYDHNVNNHESKAR